MTQTDHILVVDDDPDIRAQLGLYLEKNGFRVTTLADGQGVPAIIDKEVVSLIVLDLSLPGEDGLIVCRNLRARSSVPVVILSARGEEMDRIIGLEMGADDYLPKPFHPRELLARVKSVLRRSQNPQPEVEEVKEETVFRFLGWSLDAISRELTDPKGVTVPLSGSEYSLLRSFLTQPNRVLSRDYLLGMVNGRNNDLEPFDRTIDMQVSRLRRRLGDNSRSPTLIKTVRSAGYIFTARVEKGR